jgi:hypothetical protein
MIAERLFGVKQRRRKQRQRRGIGVTISVTSFGAPSF